MEENIGLKIKPTIFPHKKKRILIKYKNVYQIKGFNNRNLCKGKNKTFNKKQHNNRNR